MFSADETTDALAEHTRSMCGRRIDSRGVVRRCELSLTAHVSERRLRMAFTDEFDLPPSQYFRAWALNEAHCRLAHDQRGRTTVTEVARALGFDHLGRFSGHYKQMVGECPSSTLQAHG
jgi:AraC family ethanolamine operon transcriptional activator